MYDSLTYLALLCDAVPTCGPVRNDNYVAAFGEEEIEEKKEGEGIAVRDLDEGRDKKPKVLPSSSVHNFLAFVQPLQAGAQEILACACKRSQLIAGLYK